jgi:O-acetyl-ADP-ribose deacetylase (regulator of RNase III)
MELWLVDEDQSLVAAWAEAFAGAPGVQIHKGDILARAANTLVSPANSYGWMDGGIDAAYIARFGLQLQTRLQRMIDEQRGGKLEVGAALFVPTGDAQIPYLISAPTMVMPEPVPAANCFFAMSAALKVARQHQDVVTRLFCPGLGTGIGGVDPRDAAREMANAYRKWLAA